MSLVSCSFTWPQFIEMFKSLSKQEGLNKKEIQLNLCNIFAIFIVNELYLLT